MRILATVLGTCAVGLLLIQAAPAADQLTQPQSVMQVNYQTSDYYQFLGKEAVKKPVAPTSVNSCCNPCSPVGACDDCIESCVPCRSRCGWFSSITAGGWLQTGVTLNGQDPNDRFNGPLMTNDRADDIEMNQLWFYVERKINPQCGFDIGGRIDVFYGSDWRCADCCGNGIEDRLNGPDNLYGIALPQMYLEAGKGDFSVKMGRMESILGYESVVSTANFFYSHAYSLCYGQPILIFGMMGSYKASNRVEVLAGFHQGYQQLENNNNCLNFEGGVKWKSSTGRTSLAYCLDIGRNDLAGLNDSYVHSLVFQHQINSRLKYVFQNDLGYTNVSGGLDDADFYSINQYLFYKLNSKWTAGMRIELFRDDDGSRIMGIGNLPDARGWMGALGYAGSFTDLTLGLNYKPRSNMMFRPEIRWDWYDGAANPNAPYPYPFDDGTRTQQFTAACDFILTF